NEQLIVIFRAIFVVDETASAEASIRATSKHVGHPRKIVLSRLADLRTPKNNRVVEQGALTFGIGSELRQKVRELLSIPNMDHAVFKKPLGALPVVRNSVMVPR